MGSPPRCYSARIKALLHRNKGHRQYTLIAACCNVEKHIGAFIDSLSAQRLDFRRNIRLICVDNGSTDTTADIIKRYAAQYPENITYLTTEPCGRNSALMAGLSLARTEWVASPNPHDALDFNALYLADKAIAAHDYRVRYISDLSPLRDLFISRRREGVVYGFGKLELLKIRYQDGRFERWATPFGKLMRCLRKGDK